MNETQDYVALYEREALSTERYGNSSFWDARYHVTRLAAVRSMMSTAIKPGVSSFFDGGCGTGEYLAIASELGASRVVGYDLAYNYVRRVAQQNPAAAVLQGSLTALPFGAGTFDVALCSEVLEHIPEGLWPEAVDELFRVAQRTVIITTPNDGLIRGLGNRLLRGRVAALDASVGHISIYRLERLRAMLQRPGWKTVSVRTLHVTPPVVGEMAHLPRSVERVMAGGERLLERVVPERGNISAIVFERR